MYAITLFKSAIPVTRISSYREFVISGTQKGIKLYLLELLKNYPQGLSTRQISEISDIEIGSLTNPVKSLYDNGKIIRIGKVKNRTGKVAITYSLPNSQFSPSISIGKTSRYCDPSNQDNLLSNGK